MSIIIEKKYVENRGLILSLLLALQKQFLYKLKVSIQSLCGQFEALSLIPPFIVNLFI